MRISILTIVLTFFINVTVAQTAANVKPAEFAGGKEALNKYFKENLIYPEQAKRNRVEGYFKIVIAIDDKGKAIFSDFLVEMKNCEECQEEALRLINRMPRWNPKTVNEKPAYSSAVVTIVFELEEGNVKIADDNRPVTAKDENQQVLRGNVGTGK